MKNSDPAIAQKARSNIINVFDQELPTIEKDASTLCNALQDSDSYIRLQSAGILVAIARAAPEHNQVVLSCVPELLVTARDPVDRVRNDSLWVLAMNPAGPPQAAHAVFVASLQSPNYRTQECSAAGLLKEGTNQEANQKLVLQALDSAPDKKGRLNILYAITGAQVRSDTLFVGVQKYLLDPDTDVQTEALDAVAATGKDHETVASVIQGVMDSPTATKEQKLRARMALGTAPQ